MMVVEETKSTQFEHRSEILNRQELSSRDPSEVLGFIVERVKRIKGYKYDRQVAEDWGLSKSNLAEQKRVGRIPWERIRAWAERNDMHVEDLLPEESKPRRFKGPFTMVQKIAPALDAEGGFLVEEEYEGSETYAFRTDWLVHRGSTKDMHLLEVGDDLMAPSVGPRAWVLFDASRRIPLAGRIMIVSLGGYLFVRRVKIGPEGVYATADNGEDIWEVDQDKCKIMGLVIWKCTEV